MRRHRSQVVACCGADTKLGNLSLLAAGAMQDKHFKALPEHIQAVVLHTWLGEHKGLTAVGVEIDDSQEVEQPQPGELVLYTQDKPKRSWWPWKKGA